MFALHRPIQHILSTILLLAGTVAPTAYVAIHAWRIHQPSYLREVERETSNLLGLEARFSSVRHLRPGVIEFRKPVLRQPGTQAGKTDSAPLADAGRIVLRRDGPAFRVEIDYLRLRAAGPQDAERALSDLLRRMAGSKARNISMIAPDCTIEVAPGASFPLRDVVGMFRTERGAPTLTVSYRFRTDEVGPEPRCEFTLRHSTKAGEAETTLVFKTMDGLPLPAQVLNPFFDAQQWLGPEAKVEGELSLHRRGSAPWGAEFKGVLLDIELASLIARMAPEHQLSGRARMVIHEAHWDDQPGRGPGWVEADGEILAGPGSIGSTFLAALQSQLRFRLGDHAELHGREVDFLALGLTFAMHADGEIDFGGGLGEGYRPGTVLVHGDRDTPLVLAPDGSATVAGLIRTLAPGSVARSDLLIPATYQAIQRYLPAMHAN